MTKKPHNHFLTDYHDIKASHIEDCFKQFSHYEFIVTNQSQLNQTNPMLISMGLYPSAEDISRIIAMCLKLVSDDYSEDNHSHISKKS